jgi:hypothetical protein
LQSSFSWYSPVAIEARLTMWVSISVQLRCDMVWLQVRKDAGPQRLGIDQPAAWLGPLGRSLACPKKALS